MNNKSIVLSTMRTALLGALMFSAAGARAQAAHPDIATFKVQAQDVQFVFVDLQPELTRGSTSVAPHALANNARVLAKVAGITHVPMTFCIVPVAGQPGKLLPELQPYANDKNTYSRVMAGTFLDRPLVAALAAQHRMTMIVSGYATEVAVLQTALGALEAGYRVYVVVDAVGSKSKRTEQAALREMEQAGATPISVLALAAMLAPDFSRPPGKDVLATFGELIAPD